jgi:hypothetical protein
MGFRLWKHIPGKGLAAVLQVFSAVALIFEGYNQGVMGTVSGTPGFIDMAKIGANGIVTDSTKQGYVTTITFRSSGYTANSQQQRSRGCVLLRSHVGMLHRRMGW